MRHVTDQGKGVLCVAEISITTLERFASYKEDPSRIDGHRERTCKYSLKTLRTILFLSFSYFSW